LFFSTVPDLTDELLVAQAYAFMSAGFDTTAMTLEFAMHLLGQNPQVQEKARQEVLRVIQEEGSLTYEALTKMTYLENCIKGKTNVIGVNDGVK
jgi:cytochrome P450